MHENRAQQMKNSETEVRLKADKDSKVLRQKVESLQHEVKAVQTEEDSLQKQYDLISKTNMEANHRLTQMSTENAKLSAENDKLRQQLSLFSQVSEERDRYRNQYLALFKQYQSSADALQNLQMEKERLRIQLQDVENSPGEVKKKPTSNKLKSSPGLAQLREPSNVIVRHSPAKSSTEKSVLQPQAPFVPNDRISSTSESSNIRGAPVAAEPPLKKEVGGFAQAPKVVQNVHKEDVMEAPKLVQDTQDFNQFFHHPQQQHLQQLNAHHQQNQPIDRPNVHQIYHAASPQQHNSNGYYMANNNLGNIFNSKTATPFCTILPLGRPTHGR